jgi:hypothetical protein
MKFIEKLALGEVGILYALRNWYAKGRVRVTS